MKKAFMIMAMFLLAFVAHADMGLENLVIYGGSSATVDEWRVNIDVDLGKIVTNINISSNEASDRIDLNVKLINTNTAYIGLNSNLIVNLNDNFSAISNDLFSVSNYLLNASNGLVTILNSNQNTTVSNFTKINDNSSLWSNAIYSLADQVAKSIDPTSSATVSLDYAEMDIDGYTPAPTNLSITFPSLASTVSNISSTVVVEHYPAIATQVIERIVMVGSNSLSSDNAWSSIYIGTNETQAATTDTDVAFFDGDAGNVRFYSDIDLGTTNGGLYSFSARYSYVPYNIGDTGAFSGEISFGDTTGEPYFLCFNNLQHGDTTFMRSIDAGDAGRYLRVAVRTYDTANIGGNGVTLTVNWTKIGVVSQ